ncbi:hypothetical protein NDU88_007184 [Pleurodeles waltl]|uniref:Uncharacterized protein n=1 Tax=Pleurodeles waltl TaxID=8319 RepID=A0AAV7TZN7_PLEWA|nr:hypothetical protein NDU88_007184 [Pleurodeles waltl]
MAAATTIADVLALLDLHRAQERDERREELRRAAYGAGAGWLASRLAHRECKRERKVASGVQRTRSGGTLRVNRRNRRKQPRPAHTVSGHSPCQQEKTAAGSREAEKPSEHGPGCRSCWQGEQLPRAGECDQGCCLFFTSAVTVRTTAWSLSKPVSQKAEARSQKPEGCKPEGAPEEYWSPRAREEH